MGQGPNFSMYDVYVGGSLWESFDGYAVVEGERVIHIPAGGQLEIRNRAEHSLTARLDTGYDSGQFILRFKQLDILSVTYDQQTIDYEYDAVSRLLSAVYVGTSKRFDYAFDLSGNRTSEAIDGGTPMTYTYNAANQITNSGFTFDNNGNMTSDGVNAYVWDRANRLLSMGGESAAKQRRFSLSLTDVTMGKVVTEERGCDMEGLKVWYDREGDILEVIFEDAPAMMEEINDDVFERRTTDGRVVGFMVMNFSKHDREKLNLPLAVTVKAG